MFSLKLLIFSTLLVVYRDLLKIGLTPCESKDLTFLANPHDVAYLSLMKRRGQSDPHDGPLVSLRPCADGPSELTPALIAH